MVESRRVPVKKLHLDLKNFRTRPQQNEIEAARALVSLGSDRFWALTSSLLEDGYSPTENILVLETGSAKRSHLIVKEGNRRIAALKLIHGLLPHKDFKIPSNLARKLQAIGSIWKTANSEVPCAVYSAVESDALDKAISLAHGKKQPAGRDPWTAVAKARHNRAMTGADEPGLTILDKFLESSVDATQATWAGDYPLTVLEEALRKTYKLFGRASVAELVADYPTVQDRDGCDRLITKIGTGEIGFPQLRTAGSDLSLAGLSGDGVALPSGPKTTGTPATSPAGATTAAAPSTTAAPAPKSPTAAGPNKKRKAPSNADPKSVDVKLKTLKPSGHNRHKVVSLIDEALILDIQKTPHAFCFVLRSIFELSAKAYCDDHSSSTGAPQSVKADGTERNLVDVLRDITAHILGPTPDRAIQKVLHGALTELAKKDGILSVTSMNQLVHSPNFSIGVNDICVLFGNIFPLLEKLQ